MCWKSTNSHLRASCSQSCLLWETEAKQDRPPGLGTFTGDLRRLIIKKIQSEKIYSPEGSQDQLDCTISEEDVSESEAGACLKRQ